ncbi:MAG: hypothetical protein EBR59_10970 [Methylococcaceae bacterium]|nr:hypothetical protein [Methylococcaceae bacterium]
MSPYALDSVIATYNGMAQSSQTVDPDPKLLGSAATGTNAGTYYGYYSDQFGYNIVGGDLTITPKTITQTGLSVASSKVYDGNRSATVLGTANLSTEVVGSGTTSDGQAYIGDDVGLTGTATGTYNSQNVADALSVAFGGLTLSGSAAGNYVLAMQADAAATITKADAIVTANSARRYYNGTTQTVTGFTVTGLVNNETSDVLTSVYAFGSGMDVGQYPVVASGSDANYNLSFIDGILNIQKQNTSPALNAVAAMFASNSKASQYSAPLTIYGGVNSNQSIADNIKLPDNMLTALPGDSNINLCCTDQ